MLSPNYLASSFAQPEWAAAFAQDPTGLRRRLIPVLVEDCDASGLLGPIVHINLVGLGDERAAGELLAGIQPGRAKPKVPPSFPGSEQPRAKPAQPGSTTLRFEPTTVGGPRVSAAATS